MKVKELIAILKNREGDPYMGDQEVSVLLALPSMGPRAHTKVKSADFGYDWDKGLLISTEARLVPKEEKQDIYEMAYDLLMYLATKPSPSKRWKYETDQAQKILLRNGYTEADFDKFRYLFHEKTPG